VRIQLPSIRGISSQLSAHRMCRFKIERMHVGTLIPRFKKGDFSRLLIPLPSRRAQEAIGDTYFELCAKVESNRCGRELIDKMLPLLFEEICPPAGGFDLLPQIADLQKGVSYRSSDLAQSRTALLAFGCGTRRRGSQRSGAREHVGVVALRSAPDD
jgi:hypothetical protein